LFFSQTHTLVTKVVAKKGGKLLADREGAIREEGVHVEVSSGST